MVYEASQAGASHVASSSLEKFSLDFLCIKKDEGADPWKNIPGGFLSCIILTWRLTTPSGPSQ